MIDHRSDHSLELRSYALALPDPHQTHRAAWKQLQLASTGDIGEVKACAGRKKGARGVEILVCRKVPHTLAFRRARTERRSDSADNC
jgi:hypothetical protein